MPGALIIGAAIGSINALITGSAVAVGAAVGTSLGALKFLAGKAKERGQKNSPAGSVISRSSLDVSGGIRVARYVVGRARVRWGVDSQLVFAAVQEDDDAYRHFAVVLSEGPCEGVEKVWIGDEVCAVGVANGGDQVLDGGAHGGRDFTDRIQIWVYPSGDGAGGSDLRTSFPDSWTAAHKLQGKCWAHIRIHQNEERFWQRIPEVDFLVKGLKITWPGQAVPAWTNNAAAVRHWFLVTRMAVPASRIDGADFALALAKCAERVTVDAPGTAYSTSSDRYTVDGIVLADPELNEDYLSEMDYAWQGWAVEVGGTFRFRPGTERAPVATVGEHNIVEIGDYVPQPAVQDRINAVSMSLAASSDNDWLPYDLPIFEDEAGIARDGGRRARDLGERLFVVQPIHALRLAAIALRRARDTARASYVLQTYPTDFLGNAVPAFIPSDRLAVTDPIIGLAGAPYEVVRMIRRPDWSMQVELEEAGDGLYADTLSLPALKPRRLTLPKDNTPPPHPANLATSVSARIGDDGTVVTELAVTWSANRFDTSVLVSGPDGFQARAAAFGMTSRVDFLVPGPGNYVATANHISAAGVSGGAAVSDADADWSGLVPAAPVLMAFEVRSSQIWFTFARSDSLDVAGAEFRYREKAIDDVSDFPAPPTEAQFSNLARLSGLAHIPSVGGSTVSGFVTVPRSGRYQVYCRVATRQGLFGPISDLGDYLVAGGISDSGGRNLHPTWPGVLQNLGKLWQDDLLVYSAPRSDRLSRAAWSGSQGWPFGRRGLVIGSNAALPEDSYLLDPALEFTGPGTYEVRAEVGYFQPVGAAVAPSCTVEWQGGIRGNDGNYAGNPAWQNQVGNAFVRFGTANEASFRLRRLARDTAVKSVRLLWRKVTV